MIYRTTLKADAILAIIELLLVLPDHQPLRLEPYQNGREHGWSLYGPKGRQVAFSEYRNSDSIVIYTGKVGDFSMRGNVPIQEVWENRSMFDYDSIYEAARFIVDFLFEQKEGGGNMKMRVEVTTKVPFADLWSAEAAFVKNKARLVFEAHPDHSRVLERAANIAEEFALDLYVDGVLTDPYEIRDEA